MWPSEFRGQKGKAHKDLHLYHDAAPIVNIANTTPSLMSRCGELGGSGQVDSVRRCAEWHVGIRTVHQGFLW